MPFYGAAVTEVDQTQNSENPESYSAKVHPEKVKELKDQIENSSKLVNKLKRSLTNNRTLVAGEESVSRIRYWQNEVHLLLNEPDSSSTAKIVSYIIVIAIILSSTTFVIETLKAIRENEKAERFFEKLEILFVIIFTLEIGARMFGYIRKRADIIRFFLVPAHLMDIAAVVPSYFQLILGSAIDLRFLRLARVLRVVKLTRYGPKIQLVFDALTEAQDVLAMLLINLIVLVVIFSSIMYYFEKDETCSSEFCFDSIPATCWWSIVTVLTVGYGDMFPVSVYGKFTATILMLLSLIVLALPITIIGSTFSNEWMTNKKKTKTDNLVKGMPGSVERAAKDISDLCKDMRHINMSFISANELGSEVLAILVSELEGSNSFRSQRKAFKRAVETTSNLVANTKFEPIFGILAQVQEDFKIVATLMTELRSTMDDTVKLVKSLEDAKLTCLQRITERLPVIEHELSENDLSKIDLSMIASVAVVHIFGAENLVAKDLNGTSDPYVTLKHGSQTSRTGVVPKSLSPMFDETLGLFLRNTIEPIQMHVWDRDEMTKDDSMGYLSIPVDQLEKGKLYVYKQELQGKRGEFISGNIVFSLTLRDVRDTDYWSREGPYKILSEMVIGVNAVRGGRYRRR